MWAFGPPLAYVVTPSLKPQALIRPETSIAGRFAGSGTAFVNASVVEDPNATIRTSARFSVESGRPGPQPG